jgi:hypothetical protein
MSPRRICKEPSEGLVCTEEDLVRRISKDTNREEYENTKCSRSLGMSVSISKKGTCLR